MPSFSIPPRKVGRSAGIRPLYAKGLRTRDAEDIDAPLEKIGKLQDQKTRNSKLMRIKRKVLDPLEKKGWIIVDGERRGRRIAVTEEGRKNVEVFGRVNGKSHDYI